MAAGASSPVPLRRPATLHFEGSAEKQIAQRCPDYRTGRSSKRDAGRRLTGWTCDLAASFVRILWVTRKKVAMSSSVTPSVKTSSSSLMRLSMSLVNLLPSSVRESTTTRRSLRSRRRRRNRSSTNLATRRLMRGAPTGISWSSSVLVQRSLCRNRRRTAKWSELRSKGATISSTPFEAAFTSVIAQVPRSVGKVSCSEAGLNESLFRLFGMARCRIEPNGDIRVHYRGIQM